MIKKIKDLYWHIVNIQQQTLGTTKEIEWAHIFHDSIRGNSELQNLSLKVGRWAGNYSFFYLIHRILVDFKPKKVVEFGLGESTKFLSTYNESIGNFHEHIVIEQDEKWFDFFKSNFTKMNFVCQIHELQIKKHLDFEYNGYKNVEEIPFDGDLYIIDGPFGSNRFSRFDISKIVDKFESSKEFIILMDDYNRQGEQDTGKYLMQIIENKGIKIHKGIISGKKSQLILATEKYKFVLTL